MSITQNADSAQQQLKAIYQNREKEARKRKARGEKVVGYFTANVPEELILAAGMFPVQLSGDPELDTDVGDEFMEYFHDGHIRSIFDRALRGHFEFVDLLVVPRTSEGFLQLFYYLLDIKRIEPHRKLPEVYLFDVLHTAFWRTGRYNRDRMVDLRAKLEGVAGRAIDDESIRQAIRTVNNSRRQLIELQRLRHADSAKVGGADALRAIATSSFIDKESHARLMDDLMKSIASTEPQRGPRIMVKGSTLDNTAFYELVESQGAVIVASDHPWGDGTFEHLISETGDPIEALTDHYHLHSASDRQYPQSIPDARFLELVRSARVQGVIFYLDDWDDTLGWDYPGQKQALDRLGIPSLFLKQQPYWRPDVNRQAELVKAFLVTVERPAIPAELPA